MFKNQIKYYRKLSKLTQKQVAEYLCITQQAYSYYENGTREPNFDILRKLCVLFNCTADELLEIETEKDRQKVQINNSFNNSKNIKVKIK